MRESFSEYKKTLEQNLMNISYLYSGDILSSVDSQYTEIRNSPLTSPSFIINTIVNIYNESFNIMINKSKDFIIPEETIDYSTRNIFDKISELGINHTNIFCSDKSKKLFTTINKTSTTSAFPSYFYSLESFPGKSSYLFYSPLIKEDDDEMVLFITDRAIQSLVYSIQNMEYDIKPNDKDNLEWEHKINYQLYDCRFNSYKLSIRNVSRLRHDKINQILNGN